MLKFRLIARLDIKTKHLVKTVRLEGLRVVGDPAEYARRYDEEGIDEILYMDIVASLYRRNSLHDLVSHTAEEVFCPMTVGGGVRSVADAVALLKAGADSVAVNTAAIERPELITEIANHIGSQSVTLQLDAKRKGNGWEAYCDGGRQPTGKDAIAWAKEAVGRGVGQILLTSIDCEGTRGGFDCALAQAISKVVPVPVVGCGGIDQAGHILEAARNGVAGIAMAGALHYRRTSLKDIRTALKAAGVPCRS